MLSQYFYKIYMTYQSNISIINKIVLKQIYEKNERNKYAKIH